MANTSVNLLSFDKGLYQITQQSPLETDPTLPKKGNVIPSGEPMSDQLRQLLSEPSLEQALLDAIRPHLLDASILVPQAFDELIRTVKDEAEALVASTTDRNTRQQLEALVALLSDEISLSQQLMAARSQLLQA